MVDDKDDFQEPPVGGFRALLSQWKSQDTKNQRKYSDFCKRRLNRVQARQDFVLRTLSGEFSVSSTDSDDTTTSVVKKALRQPKNVYQKPMQSVVDTRSYQPPSFVHSAQDQKVILQALQKNFVFSDKSNDELQLLVAAFEKCSFACSDVIIQQGEPGDYFYILQSGSVEFMVDGSTVGQTARPGASFGELALLYTTPRAATVVATAAKTTRLFRVQQVAVRAILQSHTEERMQQKMGLLRGVDFLQSLTEADLNRLAAVMRLRLFQKNQVLVRQGQPQEEFWIIQQGRVVRRSKDAARKTCKETLKVGDCFGNEALTSTKSINTATVEAKTAGVAFTIDKITFEKVLGTMSSLTQRGEDVRTLAGIPLICQSEPSTEQLRTFARTVVEKAYSAGREIFTDGDNEDMPAVCIVRKGEVQLDANRVIQAGEYFLGRCLDSSSKYSACAGKSGCSCGILSLEDYQAVFLTGTVEHSVSNSNEELDSAIPTTIVVANSAEKSPLARTHKKKKKKSTDGCKSASSANKSIVEVPDRIDDIKRHLILGEGTFGQVWLASDARAPPTGQEGTPHTFALKIQSKHQLLEEGQGEAVMREREILRELKHPFIITLLKTYQDKDFLYSLMNLVQGGELFSVMHSKEEEKVQIPEPQAMFYALALADALAFLHRHKYVYRDLKPENVVIDREGYPVLIDLGFAKKVLDKTYTLCGTPGYVALGASTELSQ